MSEIAEHATLPVGTPRLSAAAAIAALGIVYGDIGTSPLYAFKQAAQAGGTLTAETILGVLSLIFWALILVVSLKYAVLVMRAENHGEGGIVALLALLDARNAPERSWRASLLIVGLVGAALLYGDGVITPAISVLSAIEGLKLDAPGVAPLVVPITVAILIGLFIVQRKGTGFIGGIFGPVMLVWFAAIGLLGLVEIVRAPAVLAALSPLPALVFLMHAGPAIGFAVLGAAFLAVTGGEAMYADMGHFGAMPIRMGWFVIVLPGLVLNYFGQGALLLTTPSGIENPFYLLAPGWAHYPLVVFATLATIIASQAIISGAFSLTQQAIQLGFLPRMRVLHTASLARGQIYMPLVNWLLAAGTIGAVVSFGSSDALGGAYGIAVSMLMAITTVLAALVALKWGYNPLAVAAVNGFFLVIDLIFVAANATKLLEGGWFPLALAIFVAFLMLTWRRGAALVERARAHLRQPEDVFMETLLTAPPLRLPGTAAVFTAATTGVPLALTHHIKHNKVLHERVLLISGLTTDAPHVSPEHRVKVIDMGNGVSRIVMFFGFMETPDIAEGLRLACEKRQFDDVDLPSLTYYFRRETVIPAGKLAGMAAWRKKIFSAMHLNAHRNAAYYGVPASQVVEIGLEVEI
ncbi:MAG: KUP/HAK/KT family potassium transporter [Acidisphaera sp.]|nr:KUP/HAK/KT family potassium transporter [Acidisphaera sp.]